MVAAERRGLIFAVPEAVVPEWQDTLGLDVVYLAANHMSDRGVAGIRSTLRLLDKHELPRTGLGHEPRRGPRAGVRRRRGHQGRVRRLQRRRRRRPRRRGHGGRPVDHEGEHQRGGPAGARRRRRRGDVRPAVVGRQGVPRRPAAEAGQAARLVRRGAAATTSSAPGRTSPVRCSCASTGRTSASSSPARATTSSGRTSSRTSRRA